jgi:hypothetical protein
MSEMEDDSPMERNGYKSGNAMIAKYHGGECIWGSQSVVKVIGAPVFEVWTALLPNPYLLNETFDGYRIRARRMTGLI